MAKFSVTVYCLFLLLNSGMLNCAVDQTTVDKIAKNLNIRHDIIDNIAAVETYTFQIVMENKGSTSIEMDDWAIFFCSIRVVTSVDSGPATITHINGCLHKMKVNSTIEANSNVIIKGTAQFWYVARTDTMPNWYVASEAQSTTIHPRTIASTAVESLDFVGDFDTKEKWKRYSFDKYDPYTPEKRYDIYHNVISQPPNDASVLPTPVKMDIVPGMLTINSDWVVESSDSSVQMVAMYLVDKMQLTLVTPGSHTSRKITLSVDSVVVPGLPPSTSPEAKNESYSIETMSTSETIIVKGVTAPGVWNAVQTLMSLMNEKKQIPLVTILDAPRYAYRGLMVDVARHFQPKDKILKLLDQMAMYKLNKLHLHLTDDEGWRLEIPGLPELTQIGSKQCHDLTETSCLIPQLGSGPSSSFPGSGFYTVEEYKQILEHAATRYIEVIPEIDMPGHGRAAIKSMLVRHSTEPEKYLLQELNDESKYLSAQFFNDNAINPCINSTYTFVEKVVRELFQMHATTSNALKHFHYGGDEVPKGTWVNSTNCQALKATGVSNIGEHFVKRVSEIIKSVQSDLNLAAWEDGLLDNINGKDQIYNRSDLVVNEVVAYPWQNIWEWGVGNRAYRLANAGYKIVMSQATNLYFDHPYEPDPEERGYYWATRFTDTRKVHSFTPDDLYGNIDTARSGEPISRDTFCNTTGACPALEKPENIIGMQSLLWSETVRTSDQFEYMIWPRLLAAAERSWHKAEWEMEANKAMKQKKRDADWQRVANIIGHRELQRLDKLGVDYRIPPPGANVDASNNVLMANSAIPGLPIQYSEDSGETWHDYKSNVTVYGKTQVVTRSADGRRMSRQVTVNAPLPTITPTNAPLPTITPTTDGQATLIVSKSLILFSFVIMIKNKIV